MVCFNCLFCIPYSMISIVFFFFVWFVLYNDVWYYNFYVTFCLDFWSEVFMFRMVMYLFYDCFLHLVCFVLSFVCFIMYTLGFVVLGHSDNSLRACQHFDADFFTFPLATSIYGLKIWTVAMSRRKMGMKSGRR